MYTLDYCVRVQPHGVQTPRLRGPWDSPGKNSGDLPDPEVTPVSLTPDLHWQVGSLPLVPPEKPIMGY